MGYSKQVYDKAWQEMTRRKHEARERAQRRRAEIYARIPLVWEIDREMAQGASSVAKTVIASPDGADSLIQELGRQSLELQQKRADLLQKHGYSPEYLDEQYACPRCRDQGYVQSRMCSCLRKLLEGTAYAMLSQTSSAVDCTFENFSLSYYPERLADGVMPRKRMEDTLTYCGKYAEQFTAAGSKSLLLMGNTGLGKTHLSLAIAGEVTSRGYGVIYTPVQKLMDTLESDKFSRGGDARENYSENVRLAVSCDLLVLDDLGTEFMTTFTASTLYNLINTRLIENRSTIISTNLRIPEIEEKYSQRMVSRLVCGYKVLEFFGKDIRMMRLSESQ